MRLCSRINLNYDKNISISDSIKDGLSYLKEKGFDAADFTMKMIEPLGDRWQDCIENAISDSQSLGIKFEISHLPFSLKVSTDPTFLPKFSRDVFYAIDASKMLGVDYAVIHPNTLTVPTEDFDRIRSADDPVDNAAKAEAMRVADYYMDQPLLEYEIPDGIRLLAISRRALSRSFPRDEPLSSWHTDFLP